MSFRLYTSRNHLILKQLCYNQSKSEFIDVSIQLAAGIEKSINFNSISKSYSTLEQAEMQSVQSQNINQSKSENATTNAYGPSFLAAFCKRRGVVYPGSSIYGGLEGQYDFGPLGTQLKKNIKDMWWKEFVEKRFDMLSVDSAIIMHPNVWKQSGHLENFTDKAIRCTKCHAFYRLDHLMAQLNINVEGLTPEQMREKLIATSKCECHANGNKGNESFKPIKEVDTSQQGSNQSNIASTSSNNSRTNSVDSSENAESTSKNTSVDTSNHTWSDLFDFNLLFETNFGPVSSTVEDNKKLKHYLRPETAQGIITNFENVIHTTRKKLPLGIAQIGKAFRNEISPRDFLFRSREFEQMEIEYFCHPSESDKFYREWINECRNWCLGYGLKRSNVKLVEHPKDDLSHYSVACTDIEYNYGTFWGELWGIANRADFDLKAHLPFTRKGKGFYYQDSERPNEKYIPHIVEPSVGVERLFMAFIHSSYREETVGNSTRTVLQLHPHLAPYKVSISPLVKKPELILIAEDIYRKLREHFPCDMDLQGKIGAAYRRQDEIGTPFCVTVDWDSLEEDTVTIRERDFMTQITVPIDKLENILHTAFILSRYHVDRKTNLQCGWIHPEDDHTGHHGLAHFLQIAAAEHHVLEYTIHPECTL